MHLLDRSYFGWGRTAARSASPYLGLVVHYDGPGADLTDKPHQACIDYWKSVRQYHVSGNGWADIGYSFGVCPHRDGKGEGYIFEGRGLYREQAAQPGGNTTYYSVTLMLGDGEHPTDVQVNTVRELREYLHRKTGNANTVKGHRDFYSTSCPGDILYRMVQNKTFNQAPIKVLEDEVPEYISLSTGKYVPLTGGKDTIIYFPVEYGDTGNQHADGNYPNVLLGRISGTPFSLTVNVYPDINWRLVETDPEKDYAVVQAYETLNGKATLNGWVDAGNHLYVQARPTEDVEAYFSLRGLSW